MSKPEKNYIANCLTDTDSIGQQIAQQLDYPSCVYLNAGMGMGKTTVCKSIVRAFGYQGAVTSPTYNLIQEYPVEKGVIYHMDLYRLDDPSEIEFLGLVDLWSVNSVFLIEWPEKAKGQLIPATHEISIQKIVGESEEKREFILKKALK